MVIFNGHGHTADELMQRADLSMYGPSARAEHRAQFDPQMRTRLADRLELEAGCAPRSAPAPS